MGYSGSFPVFVRQLDAYRMPGLKSHEDVKHGETLGLVILNSDKVLLTAHTGDKACYGVYISSGNISKEIRSKGSANCWMMVAQIPIILFADKKNQGILAARLYHLCMDIVFKTAKAASHKPVLMVDAWGLIRLVRLILFAFLADFPEQLLISAIAANSSPSSLATLKQLGDSFAHPLRHGASTLRRIERLNNKVSPKQISKYKSAAKKLGLNGVHQPFWRDWKFADPCEFFVPDALHQWHKFFWDHPMRWARALLSDGEIDSRYQSLQKYVGERHFSRGFTRIKQSTGREQRDLSSHFVAVVAGHKSITPHILKAFRGLIDFIYIAQYESHDEETLGYLDDALEAFHENKIGLSKSGVRKGKVKNDEFHIRKIELMWHVRRMIRLTGCAPQYSTDQTEWLNKTRARWSYLRTNKKNHPPQMCRVLDRQDRVSLFGVYLHWIYIAKVATVVADGKTRTELYVDAEDLDRLPAKFLPAPVLDGFAASCYSNETTAFLISSECFKSNISVQDVATLFSLTDFNLALKCSLPESDLGHVTGVDVWARIRVQLRSEQDDDLLLPPRTISSCPPNDEWPLGLYNFVLVRQESDAAVKGIRSKFKIRTEALNTVTCSLTLTDHFAAQLRVIFRPRIRGRKTAGQPVYAYVQPLLPASRCVSQQEDGSQLHIPDKHINMYRMKRSVNKGGKRKGLVINITDIWRPVELVPKFGRSCPPEWDATNATEMAEEFYLNCFSSKDVYQNVY